MNPARRRALGPAAGLNGELDMAKTKMAADVADGELLADAVAGADGSDTVAADPEPGPAPQPELLLPAVVLTAFDGVPDGLVYPRAFAPGDVVMGDLGEVALREGWAERKAS
jgi:hypothetical protein